MRGLQCGLGFVVILLLFNEFLIPAGGSRVRVVKVKKTRHVRQRRVKDKRQVQRPYPSSLDTVGNTNYDSSTLRRTQETAYTPNTRTGYSSNTPPQQQYQSNFENPQPQRPPTSAQTQPPRRQQGNRDQSFDDGQCRGEYCGNGIPGEAGTDYPILAAPPKTNFDCKKQQWPGYYADTDARCQVFWICQKNRGDAFLCPNGTLFNQQVFVCDWWFNVDCGAAPEYYSRNQYIYAGPGIDLFGNAVPINNRQDSVVPARNIHDNTGSRSRPPTNRPPAQQQFTHHSVDHAQTTVLPLTQQRPTSYQTSIPIIPTTAETFGPTGSSTYNRRATDQFSRSNSYSESDNTNGRGLQTSSSQYIVNSRPTTSPHQAYRKYSTTYEPELLGEGSRYSDSSRAFLSDLEDDGGSSYASYIEAQKRLHLGSNYKPSTSSSNPIAQSQRSQNKNPPVSPRTLGYHQASRNNYSQLPYHTYSSSGDDFTSTTKRNALSQPVQDDLREFEIPSIQIEQPLGHYEDGLKFAFAKTIVPTPKAKIIPPSRQYTAETKRVPQIVSTPVPSFYDVIVRLPHARIHSDFPSKNSVNVGGKINSQVHEKIKDSEEPPARFLQLPASDPVETVTSNPLFGKKIKSGKKRNSSNWSSYFYKN